MHNGPVVGSILHGSAVYQVEGQPSSVLQAGNVFFEPEGERIERFDAEDDGVTFLAYFLLSPGQEPQIARLPGTGARPGSWRTSRRGATEGPEGKASAVKITVDDLSGPQISEFLDEHVREMRSITPLESKHALDLDGLRHPGVTFWSVMDGDTVVGCGAIKRLDAGHAEVKSMRTAPARKRSGIASLLLILAARAHHHRGQTNGIYPAESGDRLNRVLPACQEAVPQVRIRVLRAIRGLPARPEQRIHDQDALRILIHRY